MILAILMLGGSGTSLIQNDYYYFLTQKKKLYSGSINAGRSLVFCHFHPCNNAA